MVFAVRLERGGPWGFRRDLREQDGWEERARFMDQLVGEGLIVLGGPLAGAAEFAASHGASSEEEDLPSGWLAWREPCRWRAPQRWAEPGLSSEQRGQANAATGPLCDAIEQLGDL